MLTYENYTKEHILELYKKTGTDPSILERTIFAFGLLEAVSSVKLPFIFKGGTSLLLLLDEPKRLSTDIDIIVDKGVDVEEYIKKAEKIFPFMRAEEDIRKGSNDIEKRHFQFFFESPISGKEINILLDVLFEDNPYINTIKRPIKNKLLVSNGEDILISLPNINSILGDKLTAFAPHTIGVPFGKGKELEIIKQLFDCWMLLQEMDDLVEVSTTYNKVSKIELGYRGIKKETADCLKDTIESCICILGRGSIKPDEYKEYSVGITAIQGHIFSGRVTGENACVYASEVLYLAACIFTGQKEYERIDNPGEYRDIQLNIKGIRKISGFRNVEPLAYAYMVKGLLMLQELFSLETLLS